MIMAAAWLAGLRQHEPIAKHFVSAAPHTGSWADPKMHAQKNHSPRVVGPAVGTRWTLPGVLQPSIRRRAAQLRASIQSLPVSIAVSSAREELQFHNFPPKSDQQRRSRARFADIFGHCHRFQPTHERDFGVAKRPDLGRYYVRTMTDGNLPSRVLSSNTTTT